MWFVWSSGSKQAFRPGQLPAPRGHGRGKPRLPARRERSCRSACAVAFALSSRIRAVCRDLSIAIPRGHPRGEIPGRFRGAWLRRSPPRPSTLLAPGPSRSFRPGCIVTRKCECATLLTLTPTFPSRPDPCGPAWSSRTSSPGVVQRSPLHRSESGSPSPRPRVSALPFGEGQPVLLAFRPRGFAPPRRLAPPRPCRFVSPCSRSWGSPCFPSSRNEVPHSAIPALRSLPSADSYEAGTCPSPWARVTAATSSVSSDHRFQLRRLQHDWLLCRSHRQRRLRHRSIPSPRALPSRPFSPNHEQAVSRPRLPLWSPTLAPLWSPTLAPLWSPTLAPLWSPTLAPLWSPTLAFGFRGSVRRPLVRSRGLRALLHRRVRCIRRRFQPRMPGAPLGLSDPAYASRRLQNQLGTSKTAPRRAASRSEPPGCRVSRTCIARPMPTSRPPANHGYFEIR